jgi:hypothetical protein
MKRVQSAGFESSERAPHRREAIVSHPQRRTDSSSPDPVLITDAAQSYEDELKIRKRRYGLMMGMRIPCMVVAAIFYQTPWLAVTLLIISIPLPWMAVLIANDRLPRKRETVNRYEVDRRALETRARPVIDSGTPTFGGPVVDGEVLDPDVTPGSREDVRRAG